ncbi:MULTISPECIES: hypothetical protein [Stenotrophomonas]|jgi:hypothetical protein|uniref:hypothetical protein n=1 Tax=Stenotrophomonas TaxID=40323 RepID=UPI00037A0CFA|nr:hypothetical protein [Stenotrophomonas sp. BIO128-Bstrain]WIA59881.1 hypothetical protein POS15_10815 [Stenotrophomonas sp. BIO128-Bstrain]
MPARPPSFVLAWLLAVYAAVYAAVPAAARPGAGSAATLQVAVRIVADCGSPGAEALPTCRPARQRGDALHPVPAQVAALSPAIADTGRTAPVTVTY